METPKKIPPSPVAVTTGEAPINTETGFDPAPFAPYEGKLVRSVQVVGNQHTRNYVVFREIHSKAGQPLSAKTLAADVQRLENIQLFSSVEIKPSPADSSVTLLFGLKEMPRRFIFPALSYTVQNGWSYGVGASGINFEGRNISGSAKALFGGTTTYSFSASDPWITGNHVSAKATIAHLERYNQFNDFEETDNYVTPIVGTYVGKYGRFGVTLSWLQVRSDVDGKTLNPDNVDNMYYTGGYLQYDSRTSVRRPSNGWYAQYQEYHTGGVLGGDANFWSTSLDFRKYSRTFGGQVLAVGAFTQLQSGTVGVDVPEYLQFYMGGANSIRGYDLDSLGQTLYGKNQFIATIEYSFQLRPIRQYTIVKWTFSLGLDLTLFADDGIAWSPSGDFNLDRNRLGGGVGLRLLVPGMQVLRFDFAQGEGGGFQFAFGTGSKFDAQTKRIR